jgi:hypothetical protein
LAKSQVLGTLVAFTIFLRIFSILLQNQVMWWEKASGKGKLYQNRLKSKIVFKTLKKNIFKTIKKNISHFPNHKKIVFKTFKIHKSFSQPQKNISANHKKIIKKT